MKKFEWTGLAIVLAVIALTYSFNLFYPSVRAMMQESIVHASSETPSPRKEEAIFKPLNIYTSKKAYYRYELVDVQAEYKNYDRDVLSTGTLTAKVYFNNKLIRTVGDMEEFNLRFNPANGLWEGKFPIPYNPTLGEYQLLVVARPDNPGPVLKDTWSFKIIGREPPPTMDGLTVMALESFAVLDQKPIPGPDGTMGDWRNVISWAKYMGADAVFAMGAMSDGDARYDNSKNLFVFRPDLINMTKKMSAESHRNGLKYGAWVMSFMLQSKNFERCGYNPSLGYEPSNDSLVKGYHISLNDKKRLQDIVNVVKEFDKNPNIDFIGLDYIRTGNADGYEMVEDVVRDMSIDVPANWKDLGEHERIVWFAKKLEVEADPSMIEKWRWWRAHKVAMNVSEIIAESGTQKPIWLFTLGWEHGKQHGQDPLMFNDAGITYDAVMLYEANSLQFRQVLIDWKNYLRSKQVNVLCGNTVDVTLLDSHSLTPPEEIVRRSIVGSQQLLFGGLTDGVFWHDLSRAFWGRKGEYSTKEWCITGGTVFSKYREEKGLSPISIKMDAPEAVNAGSVFTVKISIENISLDPISELTVDIENVDGLKLLSKRSALSIPTLNPGENFEGTFEVSFSPEFARTRWNAMVPVKVVYGKDKKHFDFRIVRLKRKSVETASGES